MKPIIGKALAHYGRYLSWDKRLQVKAVAERQMENCRFALEALRTQTKQPPEVFYEAGCPVYWPALDVTGQTFLFTEQAGRTRNDVDVARRQTLCVEFFR